MSSHLRQWSVCSVAAISLGFTAASAGPATHAEQRGPNRPAFFRNGWASRSEPRRRQRPQQRLLPNLHLSRKGYQVQADALKPVFTELLGLPAGEDHAPPPTGDPSVLNRSAGTR